jgi:NADPH:quinone reductase-like Zn-dependent oxidoreductase
MKAAFIERHGGPEVLKFGEMLDPVAASGEVVVDIVAASVNGADWKVREGKSGQLSKFPYILGRDFSGVVSAVGEGVRDIGIGDEVFAVCDAGQEGAYAEKIAIKAAIVAKKPNGLSHVDAAALALAGLTAICAIEDTLKLQAGETILIQGGAGGVASFAIQLAKHLGARVITTASASNHDYLRKIGADEIIDYNAVDFTKIVRDCDAVFDTVGGDVAQRSFTVLKPGGRAAFIASGAQAPKPDRSDVIALRPSVGRDRAHRGAGCVRGRPSAGSDKLSAQRSRGRAQGKRIPPLSRQTGFSSPLKPSLHARYPLRFMAMKLPPLGR